MDISTTAFDKALAGLDAELNHLVEYNRELSDLASKLAAVKRDLWKVVYAEQDANIL